MKDDLPTTLQDQVGNETTKLLGVRAYELTRDAIDNEILVEREEITTMLQFQRDDLDIALKRIAADGAVIFDTIGEALHRSSVEVDRRLAALATLTRQSERLHYSDSLVPVA